VLDIVLLFTAPDNGHSPFNAIFQIWKSTWITFCNSIQGQGKADK